MGIGQALAAEILNQRGRLFALAPVFLALGIGAYFSLRVEPPEYWLWISGFVAALQGLAARRAGAIWGPMIWAGALIALGFAVAGARAHRMHTPVLDWRYYGPIEGRVVAMDRSASDALRLTLDRVVLSRVAPDDTPKRVRVALHGQQGFVQIEPGMTVILTGHLNGPGGPVEPGGFDFQRHAWFLRLGAVGYTRTPVLSLHPPGRDVWVFRARMALADRIRQVLPDARGAFAAAVLTGDRSGMGQDTLQALRQSNLAHLLAISGLHMGLLAGFVFATLRFGLAAVPRVSLRIPAKQLAAFVALIVAAGYLALSGGNVATERAFVMVAVALGAVMVRRRALSLRAVAFAALIVLLWQPEALLGPGFQMSFAATTALVLVFGWMRDTDRKIGPRWAQPVVAVVISSGVAGAATAPIAAAHFNIIAQYGLVANLLSVPLMGIVVIPAGVLAILLMPLGLEGIGLWIMGQGLNWILGVAHRVSDLEGAVRPVISPMPWVLPLLALGSLWWWIWQGRSRWAGAFACVAALVLWNMTKRPHILIAENGGLVGVMTPDGRSLSRPRGSGFVAQIWLENDGDGLDRSGAAALWRKNAVVHVTGKKASTAMTDCAPGQIVVSNAKLPPLPCDSFDTERLRQTGSVAILQNGEVKTARAVAGRRLWNTPRREQEARFASRQ